MSRIASATRSSSPFTCWRGSPRRWRSLPSRPHSTVPNVGASGAIAGVLGAYILMFPQSRVNVLLGRQIVAMPAVVVLGMWIVFQLISGVGTIAYSDETANVGGVAYMAHIGGFAAGFLMAFLFRGASPPPTTL